MSQSSTKFNHDENDQNPLHPCFGSDMQQSYTCAAAHIQVNPRPKFNEQVRNQ